MASRTRIGDSDLSILPLCLGGNVFGWTADESASVEVLDLFVAGGGSMIDTADGYSAWVDGHSGGESETIIGRWMAARGNRDDLVVATKVSTHPEFAGLSSDNVRRAADASLARLGTDRIDLYYAHFDDESVPLEETIAAFSALVDAGKVRYIGASNYSADRLGEWISTSERIGAHPLTALQPKYSLASRDYESGLRSIAEREGLGVLPYAALESGFLTGKYREGTADADSPRASGAARNLDDRGRRILAALDEVSEAHGTSVTAVSIAWLRSQPTVAAPIASARRAEQLPDLLDGAALTLAPDELFALTAASA